MYLSKLEQATLFKNEVLKVYQGQPSFNSELSRLLSEHYNELKKEVDHLKKLFNSNSDAIVQKQTDISKAKQLLERMRSLSDNSIDQKLVQELVVHLENIDANQLTLDHNKQSERVIESCLSYGQNSEVVELKLDTGNKRLNQMVRDSRDSGDREGVSNAVYNKQFLKQPDFSKKKNNSFVEETNSSKTPKFESNDSRFKEHWDSSVKTESKLVKEVMNINDLINRKYNLREDSDSARNSYFNKEEQQTANANLNLNLGFGLKRNADLNSGTSGFSKGNFSKNIQKANREFDEMKRDTLFIKSVQNGKKNFKF